MFTIYAEKADVADKIVRYAAQKVTSRPKKGTDDFYRVVINGEEGFVTWGYGHLCRLSREYEYNPEWRDWHKMPLPFFPDDSHISLNIESKYPVGHQYQVVKSLFAQSDYIINATDYDREGELIFYYLYRYMGCRKPVKRLKLDRQTPEGFRDALKNLEDPSDFEDMLLAARSRSLADSIVGWNVTVAATIKCGGELCSAGRIQTTVLNMIVEREKEIANFKPQDYFVVNALFTKQDGSQYKGVYKKKRFDKKEEAMAVINACSGKKGVVKDVRKTEKKKEVPYLYNLDTLQKAAADKYHFSLERTLNTAQALYSKGFLTYPRTASQFLNDGMVPMVEHIHEILRDNGYGAYFGPVIGSGYMLKQKKRFFDDSKVDAHYAIIPTELPATGLSDDEQKIYDLVAKSVIRMVFPPAVLEQTDVTTQIDGHDFLTRGTVIKEANWMSVDATKKDDVIPAVTVGEQVGAAVKLEAKKTEPPKYYTESTLLTAMLSAGKRIEDEELRDFLISADRVALGTQATRAAIVETLFKREYAAKENRDTIRPTRRGIDFIDMLPCEDLKSAEMTGKWEKRIADIGEGKERMDSFIADIKGQTTKWCRQIMELKEVPETLSKRKDSGFVCPVCGKPLHKMDWGWGCSGYQDGCKFAIGRISGKPLKENQVKSLLETGEVKLSGLKSPKTGKVFNATLVLQKEYDEEGKVVSCELKFKERAQEMTSLTCPLCGRALKKMDWGYGCSGYQEGCEFAVGRIGGQVLTEEQMQTLLSGGELSFTGLKSKSGKKFDAVLYLKTEYGEDGSPISCKAAFKWPERQEAITSMACPLCGRALKKMDWGYGCSGYQEGCEFAVGRIGGQVLTEEQMQTLLNGGELSFTGLKSKSGKKFDAVLYLKTEYGEDGSPISCKAAFKWPKEQEAITSMACPICGSPLKKVSWGYCCERYKNGCTFHIGEAGGHVFTEEEVKQLLAGKEVGPLKGLTSKKGKTFDASIRLEADGEGGYKLAYQFKDRHTEPSLKNKKKDIYVKCPDCGCDMVRGDYGWECERHCGMEIPYIKNGREIEEKLAEALLLQGTTDYLTGFVSQQGRPMVAAIKRNGKKLTLEFPKWGNP